MEKVRCALTLLDKQVIQEEGRMTRLFFQAQAGSNGLSVDPILGDSAPFARAELVVVGEAADLLKAGKAYYIDFTEVSEEA